MMTTDQQRKILEAAAKACGLTITWAINADGSTSGPWIKNSGWNPRTNPIDTAKMCAKLNVDSYWWHNHIACAIGSELCKAKFEDHNNSRLKAWMYAATMVAAKIGDLK